ncbi:MAG: chorismate synthase [Firmicutes bacterium]|nr:chorismate synthase [Bacillota bacterium]
MKNTFGHSVSLTLFGESHGPAVGGVIDGLAPGIPVDGEAIRRLLDRRRPSAPWDTPRREADDFRILSGVFQGKTTGTPLCIVLANQDQHSGDYEKNRGLARPSHGDYAGFCKYHGYEDYRGGGHFSGRVTAALTALGAVLLTALAGTGVALGTHILRCGGVEDRDFDCLEQDIACLNRAAFPVLTESRGEAMIAAILAAKEAGDSIGGVVQTAVTGLPAGLGEPWFDSVEGLLSHALFSIGGVKAVSFGDGFQLAELRGSQANDAMRMEKGRVITVTNRNGGINGGVSNGMPILFQCAVKPTPSIGREQQTVNFLTGENAVLRIAGRHDPAIVRRICPVIDAVTALVLCDLLAQRYGTDVFTKGRPVCDMD